jgi:hypothetical protein
MVSIIEPALANQQRNKRRNKRTLFSVAANGTDCSILVLIHNQHQGCPGPNSSGIDSLF